MNGPCRDSPPDIVSFTVAIQACQEGAQWNGPLELLEEDVARRAVVMVSVGGAWECWTPKECMRHRRIWPDVMSFNLALRASAQRWQCARQLLSGAHLGIRPNLLSFDSLLSPELGWNATLVLLGQLASLNLEPNTAHGLQVTLNAALASQAEAGRWQQCQLLFDHLPGAGTGIRPDLISFNSAMKASKACQGRWCWSSDLLQRMQLAGSMPDSISLTSSIAAKGRGMQWRLALQGLYARSGRTIRQNVIICTAAVGACHAADEWLAALAVLGTMVLSAVEHDAMSQNWETHAYAGASQWAQALLPHALGATQNEFGSHLTLALAESGHQWQLALQMLRGSRQTSLKPTACDVSSAMTAATACARWPHALNLFTSSRLVLESQGGRDLALHNAAAWLSISLNMSVIQGIYLAGFGMSAACIQYWNFGGREVLLTLFCVVFGVMSVSSIVQYIRDSASGHHAATEVFGFIDKVPKIDAT
ncbi:unnamed protein product [Symbiodinium natans]|uniref:Pentatricopeptide repeat-containing protein, chloroplastic n=1 Tax=Symbiodinium natans TaxID=878477 RepID=A0A812R9T5_9DINO|nr:unnamed protein product [Symbiodinium natans]